MGAPTRIRRLRRSDAGSLLLETMVAIVIVTVVLFGVTAVLITGVQSSAKQRNAQAAVQIATAALDQIQALGAKGPDSLPDRTINGTTFRTAYTYTPCTFPILAGACVDVTSGPVPADAYVRAVATVTWSDRTCPASGCTYASATLVGGPASDAVRQTTTPQLTQPSNVTTTVGLAMTPIQLVATSITAPPVIFSGTIKTGACSGGGSAVPLAQSGSSSYGLTIDPLTGKISGTPSGKTDYCVTATVTDAALTSDSKQFTLSSVAPCFTNITSARQAGNTYVWPYDSNVLKPDPTQARCTTDVSYTVFEARVAIGDIPAWPQNIYAWDAGQLKCGVIGSTTNATTRSKDSVEKDSNGLWRIAADPMQCVTAAGPNTGTVAFYNPRDAAVYCIGIDETRAGVTTTYYVTWTFGTAPTTKPWRCTT